MTNFSISAALVIFVLVLGGCSPDSTSAFGFRLPDGDTGQGREVFAYMQCNQCHTVVGKSFPEVPLADPPYVELGGNVTRVKTYGELVTAIINPSHRLAKGYAAEVVSDGEESKMYVYNGYMTVQELIDLVAFLQSSYDVVLPEYHYRVYP